MPVQCGSGGSPHGSRLRFALPIVAIVGLLGLFVLAVPGGGHRDADERTLRSSLQVGGSSHSVSRPSIGVAIGWVFLLNDELVRGELGLTDEQRERLEPIIQGYVNGVLNIPPPALDGLERREREKAIADVHQQRSVLKERYREQAEALLTSNQLVRLRQIDLQLRGVQALYDPQVLEELGISAEHREQVARIRADVLRQRSTLVQQRQGGGLSQMDYFQRVSEDLLEGERRILAVFSPEERDAWVAALGDKIPFDRREVKRGIRVTEGRSRTRAAAAPAPKRPEAESQDRER